MVLVEMVFGTGAPMFGLGEDDDFCYEELIELRAKVKKMEKEIADLKRQLMLAKNSRMLDDLYAYRGED